MVLLLWIGSFGVGIAVGIGVERRLLGRLAPLTRGTTRGGVLVGTVLMVVAALVVAVCAVVGAGLASDGHGTAALTVACLGNAVGAALAEPLLPWVSQSGWRFVRAIAEDARRAGVPRPAADGMARGGAVLGYLLMWPAVFAMMATILGMDEP